MTTKQDKRVEKIVKKNHWSNMTFIKSKWRRKEEIEKQKRKWNETTKMKR